MISIWIDLETLEELLESDGCLEVRKNNWRWGPLLTYKVVYKENNYLVSVAYDKDGIVENSFLLEPAKLVTKTVEVWEKSEHH